MLNKIIYTVLGIGIALVFFPRVTHDTVKQPVIAGAAVETDKIKPQRAAPEMSKSLAQPILTAKSSVAFDLNSGTLLFSKNLDEKLPIASLTKLMTALVVVKHAKLEDIVTIKKQDLTGIGNAVGLVENERIKVLDLLKAMLIPSGNYAALALARFVASDPVKFSSLMNTQAKNLHLVDTSFSNPVGWDSWDGQENFSSALDLIKITQAVLANPDLRAIVKTKETEVSSVDGKYSHNLLSTNQMLLDDTRVEGVKTGFTSKALGSLIILYNHNGANILTIVLDSKEREIDSQNLLDWVLSLY